MARIRTIKPEFWSDEKLGPLPPMDRLVFLGLISMADDEGRLVDSVRQLNGLLFPHTDHSVADSLDTLARLRRILRYTSASGQSLIQIMHWTDHQRVDRPSRYSLPGPCPQDFAAQPLTESSRDTRDTLATRPRTNDLRPTTNDHVPRTDLWPVRPRKVDGRYEYPKEFEAAWESYPTRRGDNPKVGAYKAFRARVKSGDDPASLVAAAIHYRTVCQHEGREDTPYVKQASTFWGPDEPWREYIQPPVLKPMNGNGIANPKARGRL